MQRLGKTGETGHDPIERCAELLDELLGALERASELREQCSHRRLDVVEQPIHASGDGVQLLHRLVEVLDGMQEVADAALELSNRLGDACQRVCPTEEPEQVAEARRDG